jgi:hypothetical protein
LFVRCIWELGLCSCPTLDEDSTEALLEQEGSVLRCDGDAALVGVCLFRHTYSED